MILYQVSQFPQGMKLRTPIPTRPFPKATLQIFQWLLMAASLLAIGACPAGAQRTGMTLDISNWKGWTVKAFSIEGLSALEGRALRRGLAYDGEARWLGFIGRKRPAFSATLLDQDMERARLYLAKRGYPAARVEALYEADDVARRLKLQLLIDPGTPTRIAALELTGVAPPLDSLLRSTLALTPGRIFRDASLDADQRRLVDGMRSRSHARASSENRIEAAGPHDVILRHHVTPGPACRITGLVVEGVDPDLKRLALRHLVVLEGKAFRPRRLNETRDQLRLLGVYRQIQLELEDPPTGEDPGNLILHARLAPRKHRTLEAGLGYWTVEGWRVGGAWAHANLLGGGRGGELRASASLQRQAGHARLWWPGLFGRLVSGESRYAVDRQRETSYNSLERELRFTLRWRPTLLTVFSGGVGFSSIDLDILSPDTDMFTSEPGRLTSFRLDWVRDSSSDPFDPRHGTISSLQVEWTVPGLITDSNHLRLIAERAGYRQIGSSVGAIRVRIGAAWPLASSTDLLPTRRFYAGGTDHRGFARRELGPRDTKGSPVGGEFLALLSSEIRLPLPGPFRLALFADVGQVWSDKTEIEFEDLELAAGPGLQVSTPVGPLRGDVGLRLGPGDDRPGWAAHVSIGHPF